MKNMGKKIAVSIVTLIIFTFIIIMINNKTSDKKFSGVYLNGKYISDSENFEYINNNIFLSLELLEDNGFVDIFFSEEEKLILIYDDLKSYKVDLSKKDSSIWYEQGGRVLLNYDYIKDKVNEKYNLLVYEGLLFIENEYSEITNLKDIKLYTDTSKRSARIINIKEGSILLEYDKIGKWCLVRYDDKIGYVKDDYLKSINSRGSTKLLINTYKKKIVLAWDFFTREPSEFEEEDLYKGMNTVCPTWHHLEEDTLEFSNWYIEEYVEYYNENKIEVWGTFSNSFDPDLTSRIMNTRDGRNDIADKIVAMAVKNNYVGVNIDFENIYLRDKEKLASFIRELYIRLNEKNIIMSIDVTVISQSENWSLFYDRKTIGKYSDYVVLMAYDERTQPEHGIGSIASLPWVEKGIIGLMEYVNSDKIILGLPFYTRLWETIETNNGINYDVTAMRLTSVDKFVTENKFTFQYDEEIGQNYGEKIINNIKYQIWVEDEVSLKNRLELVEKYNLNGVGVWCLNYSKNSMWKLIENFFKNM